MNILIGCDPEVFVKNPNSGEFVSAHGMVPGDKKKPFPVPFGAVQVDGMALEFNIDPADSKHTFVDNIQRVYQRLEDMVPGYTLVKDPVAVFNEEYFKTCDTTSQILWCDPYYNSWSLLANDAPKCDIP